MFQKIQIQMLPIYDYLPFAKVKPCILLNYHLLLLQNTVASDYFIILHIIHTKS